MKIAWHGDEAPHEITFMNRTLDDAYLWLTDVRLRSMHERHATLTGTILALTLLGAPAHAEKDAATKAREGDINHWIEYYRKNQRPLQPVAPERQTAVVEEEREKRKAKR